MAKAKKTARKRAVTKKPAAASSTLAAFLAGEPTSGDVTLRIGKRAVELTHLDRVYWPADGTTKGDLLRYYAAVGETIVPYLAGRPAILMRYPSGIGRPVFYQHDVPDAPDLLRTEVLVSETGRSLHYAIYTDLASLLYLVNLGTIAQNPWHATVDHLETPDYLVLDLDPKRASFASVREVALAVRDVLADEGLTGFAKTSGSSGIHIYVPLVRRASFDHVLAAATTLATRVAQRVPRIATVARSLDARGEKQVYVDAQQNARGKSAASVYSVRARAGATVSAPVTWDEIAKGIAIEDFTLRNMPARIARMGDLWKDFFTTRQSLPRGL